MKTPNNNILNVEGLKMYFPLKRGLLRKKEADIKAVDGVNFRIKKGETLGLVGESGSGKTTTGKCILRLHKPTEGKITFNGKEIASLRERDMKPLRPGMSMIFQDPYSSLDPRQKAGAIVGEPLIIHRLVRNRKEYRDRVEELFRLVNLDPRMIDRVPHEFSGGQRQRVGIARALAGEPSLLICDEPVSALDVSIQAQVINLLKDLREKMKGLSYLFIAHDLSVVRHISHRIAVMYLGRIVEVLDQDTLYDNPLHPYTRALLSAVPVPDPFIEEKRERIALKGEIPSVLNSPSGCSFHPRCPLAKRECRQKPPDMRLVGKDHEVACHLV